MNDQIWGGCRTNATYTKQYKYPSGSSRVKLLVVSDDLTGACGIGSLMYPHKSMTVNVDKLDAIKLDNVDFLSVNIDARYAEYDVILKTVSELMNKLNPERVALRIDSLLRGSTAFQITAMSTFGKVLVTDTIPEYGRYTAGGITNYEDSRLDMIEYLEKNGLPDLMSEGRILVRDSKTSHDITALARKCIEEDYIPADPGLLIAAYSKMIK